MFGNNQTSDNYFTSLASNCRHSEALVIVY